MISPIIQNNIVNNQPSFKGISNAKKCTSAAVDATTYVYDIISKSNAKAKQIKQTKNDITDKLHEYIAQKLVAPVMNSKFMNKCADKSINIDNLGAHMSTAGSIVTTAVYANQTLHKKELDKKRAKTLALNQCLVTAFSTLSAYTINSKLDKFSKNLSYKFRELNQGLPVETLSKRIQGFNLAKQLLIFTCMYRYIAPVIVTPVASKISKLMDKENRHPAVQQIAQNPVQYNGVNARDNFYKNLELLKSANK